jgi:hypothetical protein
MTDIRLRVLSSLAIVLPQNTDDAFSVFVLEGVALVRSAFD